MRFMRNKQSREMGFFSSCMFNSEHITDYIFNIIHVIVYVFMVGKPVYHKNGLHGSCFVAYDFCGFLPVVFTTITWSVTPVSLEQGQSVSVSNPEIYW